MNKTQTKNLLVILIPLIVLIIAGFSLVTTGIITLEAPNINTDQIDATLIINYGNENINTYIVTLTNPTVFNVLDQASTDYDFTFRAEYDEQYRSNYIYSINSIEEGNNLYWQYYLNGNYGIFGADIQTVKDND
ncbi:MAG: DUF4430 domain-containing protein, partial [Thermoplasmatales archaeon]|nr:DUF4430 domain-containing protein [Thermoplasmatales archaeon]